MFAFVHRIQLKIKITIYLLILIVLVLVAAVLWFKVQEYQSFGFIEKQAVQTESIVESLDQLNESLGDITTQLEKMNENDSFVE